MPRYTHRLKRSLPALAALLVLVAGCGGSSSGSTGDANLTVSAAASLKNALTDYGNGFKDAKVRLSFAGSDELAAQIRQGVKPDVFASANTKLPDALFSEGLVEKPVVFARNRLVIAVPAGSTRVRSIDDLAKPGVKLAVGSESVPVGSYTRQVLGRLGAAESKAILANVRSSEPDVKGVVGKISQGAVDAGFVYITDVKATKGALTAIDLPASLQPSVAYGVAIVKGAKNPAAARSFVDGLVNGDGARILRAAGFEAP
jgi:molybdate transport system substrate-binding protein